MLHFFHWLKSLFTRRLARPVLQDSEITREDIPGSDPADDCEEAGRRDDFPESYFIDPEPDIDQPDPEPRDEDLIL